MSNGHKQFLEDKEDISAYMERGRCYRQLWSSAQYKSIRKLKVNILRQLNKN